MVLLAAFAVAIAFVERAAAQTIGRAINAIRVEDNQRIEVETVRSYTVILGQKVASETFHQAGDITRRASDAAVAPQIGEQDIQGAA